jgi:hypothetical protein
MLFVHVTGITGGGYDVLGGALSGKYTVEILLVLGGCKLVATVFLYSSGGAGGIFASVTRLIAVVEAAGRQEFSCPRFDAAPGGAHHPRGYAAGPITWSA